MLIVEDHAGFRSVTRRLLAAAGFEVVGEAAGGLAALAAVRELRPDLVLLDVQLPDLDGFEVARRLRAAGDGPAVVLTSSRDRGDYGRRVDDCGANGFIPKADLSGPALHALVRAVWESR